MKLNTDGLVTMNPYEAACRGVLCDHDERFIAGFSSNRGYYPILRAKLWGILYELKLVNRLGLMHVVVETDSLTTVQLI